jgi:hypothetical protein
VPLERGKNDLGQRGKIRTHSDSDENVGKHVKLNLRPQSNQKNPNRVINNNRHGLQRQRQTNVEDSSEEDAKHFRYNQGQKRSTEDNNPTQHIRKRLRAQHIALASAKKEMDLINYLLQHISVDKLVTAMKDSGFVLASNKFASIASIANALPSRAIALTSSFISSSSCPSANSSNIAAKNGPCSYAATKAQRRQREREREGETERVRQTTAANTPSRARAGQTTHARAGPTNAPPLPLPSQVTGPPSLPPFPARKGKGGAKKKIKAMLRQWRK